MINPKDYATRFEFNRARFNAIHRGDQLLPDAPLPVRIKILMVTDGVPEYPFFNATYGRLYFSLSEVVHLLENNPEPWVKFELTKVHRQEDLLGESDIDSFRFTRPGFDINEYDQVWFFGMRFDSEDQQRLNDEELAILARWMDERQGGVFATGDHLDIGASLCSRIPRVRAMRRWTAAQGVPSSLGPDRHDTLQPGHDCLYQFNDESDDVPQPISPKMFALPSLWFEHREAPHPLLCWKKGIIDVLPDHAHEGEVIKPESLTRTFTFLNYANKPEFPFKTDGSGQREPAHVIATGRVRQRTNAEDAGKGTSNGKTIGVIGAYNGHAAGVGRVAVDSTWHHWFDVNLVGRPDEPEDDRTPQDWVESTDPKSRGFLASVPGWLHYTKILNYFRNTALWLSPPQQQDQLFFRAVWRSFMRYPQVEQLDATLPLSVLGKFTLDAINGESGPCTVRTWLHERLAPVWSKHFFLPHLDTSQIGPPIDVLERLLIGGVTRELLLTYGKARKTAKGVTETEAVAAAIRGLELGGQEFKVLLEGYAKSTSELARELQKSAPLKLSPKQFALASKHTRKVKSGGKTRRK